MPLPPARSQVCKKSMSWSSAVAAYCRVRQVTGLHWYSCARMAALQESTQHARPYLQGKGADQRIHVHVGEQAVVEDEDQVGHPILRAVLCSAALSGSPLQQPGRSLTVTAVELPAESTDESATSARHRRTHPCIAQVVACAPWRKSHVAGAQRVQRHKAGLIEDAQLQAKWPLSTAAQTAWHVSC